jgi:hypothetical protein
MYQWEKRFKRGEIINGYHSTREMIKEASRVVLDNFKTKRRPIDIAGWNALVQIYKGQYVNYFVETKELLDFLCRTQIKDIDGFSKLISEKYTQADSFGRADILDDDEPTGMRNESDVRAYWFAGAIHAPGIENSIIFLAQNAEYEGKDHKYKGSLFVTNGKIFQLNPLHDLSFDAELSSYVKAIINLFLYMDCFPDSVHEGTPDVCIQSYRIGNNSKAVHIATHESLIERSGVTPHLRRGHFRLLASEHFTKKRGQTVFVHAAFVKGHAETVEDVGAERVEMIQ